MTHNDGGSVVEVNALCEECGQAAAYTLISVDGENMAVCLECHQWLDHHSIPVPHPASPNAHIDGTQ